MTEMMHHAAAAERLGVDGVLVRGFRRPDGALVALDRLEDSAGPLVGTRLVQQCHSARRPGLSGCLALWVGSGVRLQWPL
jgi:hypothetical protein